MSGYNPQPQKRVNAGFPVGLTGGLIMIFVSLAIFFMNGAESNGDRLVWFIQVVAYIFLARGAANRQAEFQVHSYEPTSGVAGAAVGAPLITSIMMWVFIILRDIIRDASGTTVTIEPVSFCGSIILDVLLALGIGGWTANAIKKQHDGNPYDTSNF